MAAALLLASFGFSQSNAAELSDATATETQQIDASEPQAIPTPASCRIDEQPPEAASGTPVPDRVCGEPDLYLQKSVANGKSSPFAYQEVILFEIYARNDSYSQLTGVNLTDPTTTNFVCDRVMPATLEVSEAITCTAEHVVEAADFANLNNLTYLNTAFATADQLAPMSAVAMADLDLENSVFPSSTVAATTTLSLKPAQTPNPDPVITTTIASKPTIAPTTVAPPTAAATTVAATVPATVATTTPATSIAPATTAQPPTTEASIDVLGADANAPEEGVDEVAYTGGDPTRLLLGALCLIGAGLVLLSGRRRA